MDYCDSNKQMGRVCVSRISIKPCKFQGITAISRETLIKTGYAENVGKERKVKKKITEWLKMKVPRITLRWAGLKVQNGCKNLAIVHGRVRDDVEKQWKEQQQNEKYWQMKIQQQNKNLLRGSPKQSTIAGSFLLLILKNYYRINYNKRVFI